MKDSPGYQMTVSREGTRGIERILDLETRLARTPMAGRKRRELVKAIGIAAAAYRTALDNEQATATHDSTPLAITGRLLRSLPTRKTRGPKRS